MLCELSDILTRRKFAQKIKASQLRIDEIVDGYAALTRIVRPAAGVSGIAPDPDDDVVIATALSAGATALVTGDRPLLSVGHHDGVNIMTVNDALNLLNG